MDREIWEIERRLRERMEEIARETYSRTAKLDSDLQRLSQKVDTRGWHARTDMWYAFLLLVPPLSLLFLVILLRA